MPGISTPHAEISLEELEGLATTAQYEPVATLTQRLTDINPKTFVGSGKVEELKLAVKHHNPEAVIFDEELSPRQNRELENILKCRVMDRPWVILEIFSNHARTREAKTQVELARMKYALPPPYPNVGTSFTATRRNRYEGRGGNADPAGPPNDPQSNPQTGKKTHPN